MGWIGQLGVIVGIVVLITLTRLYVVLLTKWLSCKSFWTSRVKFKQWRKLYDLNPEKWCTDDDNPYRCIYTDGHHKDIYVRFSFFGTARYIIWQSQAEKRKKQVRSNAKLQLLLRAAQTDIERLKAQADREMEEAKRQTEETKARISTMNIHTTSGGSGLPTSEKTNHATDLWF